MRAASGSHGALFHADCNEGDLDPPERCKATTLKVFFKAGEDPDLQNLYRPINIIPITAKLFSTIIYEKILDNIDGSLSEEQFGFRRRRGCAAAHALRIVVKKAAQWGEELWVATLDVEKASDRLHHSSLFQTLLKLNVDPRMVAALRRLYSDMRAHVLLRPGGDSQMLMIQRGARRGDPLSPLLFNLGLDEVFVGGRS